MGFPMVLCGQERSIKGTRDKVLGLHLHGGWQGMAHLTG